MGHDWCDRVPTLRDLNGRLQEISQGQGSKALMKRIPARNSAWHSDAIPTSHRAIHKTLCVTTILGGKVVKTPIGRRDP